jgi:hypothetical protein
LSTRSAPTATVQAATLVATPVIATAKPEPVPTADPIVDSMAAELNTDTDIVTLAKLAQIRAGLSQGLTLFPGTVPTAQPLMLASLEQGTAGLIAAPLPVIAATVQPDTVASAAPRVDLREVTGTRVNMRDGPGTIYPVVSRLTIGHKVEVLGESGTGWLRLRILPEEQIGWIAASLISKVAR